MAFAMFLWSWLAVDDWDTDDDVPDVHGVTS